ncbi:ferritin-like domain-containing protein [Pendulispora albinea]|uniref:Ferritin-like domain-containing protein n=1 Tax=Pendulispora albinea TaxID=2741071 RepID=A0ABZ2LNK7_9BACT
MTTPLLSPEAFVRELDEQNRRALERIAQATKGPAANEATPGSCTPGSASASKPACEGKKLDTATLLRLALKNELEATECAAAWIPTTTDVDVKLALARQAGDEAKHYRLIQKRLGELGIDTSQHDPLAQGRSPLLEFLLGLEGTVARVAAGQFTREALAVVKNTEFVLFCEEQEDFKTAALYKGTIQPDEEHHHELGRTLLLKLATTVEAQEAARAASRRTLELAEELQEIARMRAGIVRAPGC